MAAVHERRRTIRYRLEADLHFLALDTHNQPQVGEGRSWNMSSAALMFRPKAPLPEDWHCCAAVVKWPAKSDDAGPATRMMILGHPVRTSSSEIAMSISQHRFLRVVDDDAAIASLLLRMATGRSATSAVKGNVKELRPLLQVV